MEEIPESRESIESIGENILGMFLIEEIFTMKLNLKINEIAVNLINEKNNILIGRLGIENLRLFNGISNTRMLLKGSLKELFMV